MAESSVPGAVGEREEPPLERLAALAVAVHQADDGDYPPLEEDWEYIVSISRQIARLSVNEGGVAPPIALLRRWRDASLAGDSSDLVDLTNETTDLLGDGEGGLAPVARTEAEPHE